MYNYIPLEQAADILDSYRKPVNNKERLNLIKGKPLDELFPYYGATGQVGWIDSFLTDGEYILLGEDGAPFLNPYAEKAYIIYGKTWVNNHAHILRSKTNNEFLCYYLNYFNYKNYVSGTTRLKLTQAQMRKIPIPNIPSDEQFRIVARIEGLFSELDKAVDTLKTTKEQLAVYRQAVLKDAFDSLPECVKMESVAGMIDPQPSHRTPPEVPNGIPYIGIGDIDYIKKQIDFDSARKVSVDVFDEQHCRYILHPGDFVMGKIGTIGKPYILPSTPHYALSANVILIQPYREKINPKFLFWQFSSPLITKQLMVGSKATSQPAFGIKKARELNIRICEKEKQDTLLEDIEAKMSVCDSIEKTVDTALAQADAMRQSILKQAFEGKF